jgi:hypothetical protein
MLLDGRPAYQPEVWPFEGGAGTPLGPPRRGTRGWAWSEDGASVYGLAAATAPGQLEYSRIDVASGRVLQSRTVPDSLFWLLQGSLLLDLPRSQSSPWEGRAYPQGGTAPLVFSLPEPGRIVFTLTTRPDGQGSWLMYLIGAPAGFKASLNDTAYTIHVARPGLPAVRLLDLNGPWGAPGLLHLAPGPVFELRVERHDGSKHRLLAEPGRSPRDLGPMPVSLPWPTSFSADGRRGVLVEAESPRTDIWLLRWPGADSAGAGGKR